jgi:hypothetical protein
VQESLGAQANAEPVGDEASKSTPVAEDLQFVNASPNLSRQMIAQGAGATTDQKPAGVVGGDGDNNDADGIARADAQAGATAAGKSAKVGLGVVTPGAGETFKLQVESPTTVAPAGKMDAVPPFGKAGPKNAVDATGSKSSDLANTTDAGKAGSGKAKGADAIVAVPDAASHSAQSNGQSMQHAQSDGSQIAPMGQKVVEGGVAQAVPVHAVIHIAATDPGPLGGPQDGTHAGVDRQDVVSSPLDGDEQTATSGINASKLIQTLSETEMRVGMHSAEFGNISIRTSVSQQQVLAQISLDHGDLGQAITGLISSMQTKLGNDYGLQTLIQVNHQDASFAGGQGSSPQRDQSALTPSGRAESVAVPAELDVGISPGALASAGHRYRLDIRA